MKEENKYKVCGRLLFEGEHRGNGLLISLDNSFYCVTAAHCLYGDKFNEEPNLQQYSFQVNSHQFSIESAFDPKINYDLYDVCVLKIIPSKEIADQESFPQVQLNDDKLNSLDELVYRGVAPNKSESPSNRFVLFDELEEGSEYRFRCEIDKKHLESFDGITGSEWLRGLSGSPVFISNKDNTHSVGIIIEVPDDGESGKIVYAGLSPLRSYFNELFGSVKAADSFKHKSSIPEASREFFIGNISIPENYVPRYCKKDFDQVESYSMFELDDDQGERIIEVIKGERYTILVGNPGIGKTSELHNLAVALWDSTKENLVPIFRNLRDFTSNRSLLDYVSFDRFAEFKQPIFILDGIDEIADRNHFLSELNTLISGLDRDDVHFLLSCRSSIAKGIYNEIGKFKTYSLAPLSFGASLDLFNKTKDPDRTLDEKQSRTLYNIRAFLSNPSQLKLVVTEFNSSGIIQNNLSHLWGRYVSQRLRIDHKTKFKKFGFDRIQFRKDAKTVSIVNELSQKTVISDDALCEVVDDGSNYDNFIQAGLIDSDREQENWFFEHRSIQEYFFAEALSKLTFKDIIRLVRIEGTTYAHPSLHNVITFLLNFDLESQLFSDLRDWMLEGSVELLINSDSNLITDQLRTEVFQNYFRQQCVEDTLWINTRTSVMDHDFARFGNSRENFNFLLAFIADSSSHFRTRKSATDLISEMDLFEREKLLKVYNSLLRSNATSLDEKANLISSLKNFELHRTSEGIISSLIEIFQGESHAAVNSAILRMIFDVEKPDSYFDFLIREYKYFHEIEKREIEDNTARFGQFYFDSIILKLELSEHFLQFISYSGKLTRNHVKDSFSKILERVTWFAERNNNFVEDLCSQFLEVGGKDFFLHRDDVFTSVINATKKQTKAFKYIFNNVEFGESKWLLARIADKKSLAFIIGELKRNNVETDHLQGFRNILNSYGKYELAKEWEIEAVKLGHEFTFDIRPKSYFDTKLKEGISRELLEFEIILNQSSLIKEVLNLFEHKNASEASRREINSWDREFYEIPEMNQLNHPLAYSVAWRLSRFRDPLGVNDVKELLENDDLQLDLLRERYEGFKKLHETENFPDDLRKKVEEFVQSYARAFEFSKIIVKVNDPSSFNISRTSQNALKSLTTILDFYEDQSFTIQLSQQFLLDCLEYYRLMTYGESEQGFKDLANSIKDKSLLRKQVCENIEKHIASAIWKKHIEYALANNYTEVFGEVREYLLLNPDIYPQDEILNQYLESTDDKSILTDHCTDMSTRSAWTCLKRLSDEAPVYYRSFILEKLSPVLSNPESQYWGEALSMLFKLNHEDALFIFVENFRGDLVNTLHTNVIAEYNAIKSNDYSLIKRLFHLVYDLDVEGFEYHENRTLINVIINNLSKQDESFMKVRKTLQEIRADLNRATDDVKFFFVNLLLNDSEKRYVEAKSTPFSFQIALDKARKIC